MILSILFSLVFASTAIEVLPYTQWATKSVMFITAHPDDIECFAGGLVSSLRQQGTTVYYVIVTNGDKGCGNPFCQNYTTAEIAAARKIEAVNAAAVFDIPSSNVVLLGYEDAEVTGYPDTEMRRALIRQIRLFKPYVVITSYLYPDLSLLPSMGWDDFGYHPDHQAVGRYALDSSFDSGLPLLYPDLGPGWFPGEFYLFRFSDAATHYVDITNTLSAKIQSYLEHKSQYADPVVMSAELTRWTVMITENLFGSNGPKYVEGYQKFS